jgi:hypothetical protein
VVSRRERQRNHPVCRPVGRASRSSLFGDDVLLCFTTVIVPSRGRIAEPLVVSDPCVAGVRCDDRS